MKPGGSVIHRSFVTGLLLLCITFLQCRNKSAEREQILNKYFSEKTTDLSGDFDKYYTYRYYNIKLSRDFIGMDSHSVIIDKMSFLKHLSGGDFMPMKIDTIPTYKLFRLPAETQSSIRQDIKRFAEKALFHAGMEGKPMPVFSLTDIAGRTYDNAAISGNITVIKCWFIRCVACVKEFPELNELVKQNNDRNDIQFISFALDSGKDLSAFLKNRQFDYVTLSNAGSFLQDSLLVDTYPTHILLDKNGTIVKYSNEFQDLVPVLEKLKEAGISEN